MYVFEQQDYYPLPHQKSVNRLVHSPVFHTLTCISI